MRRQNSFVEVFQEERCEARDAGRAEAYPRTRRLKCETCTKATRSAQQKQKIEIELVLDWRL